MAVQMSTFISGRMDNVIFYKRCGSYFSKAAPVNVQQSVATRARSKNFETASSAGKILRRLLEPSLPFPKDKNMQRRFSGAIAKWLGLTDTSTLPPGTNLPYINGFAFNSSTSISARWRLPLTVTVINDHLIELAIPAFVPTQVISAPLNTVYIECRIITASCNLPHNNEQGRCAVQLSIPYNIDPVPSQVILLTVPVSSGCLVVTAAAFTYRLQDGSIEQREAFMPSGVIDARYV